MNGGNISLTSQMAQLAWVFVVSRRMFRLFRSSSTDVTTDVMNPKYMMIDDDNNDDFTGRLNTVKTDSREPYNTVLKHDWLISIGANSIPLHVRTATEKETSIDFWCTNPLSEQTAPI